MPKWVTHVLLILACLFGHNTNGQVEQHAALVSEKTLIIYLSRTNNTKVIAEIIQTEVGGDLVALELETPYPEDYDAIVKQVAEENETGFLPPLKTSIDISRYDTIFLGFPTWGMQLPPPLKSFLSAHDLSGKTIIPFNTHAGYGVGSGFKTTEELCKGCSILKGFSIRGGIERDGIYLVIKGEKKMEATLAIKSWLKQVNIQTLN
ncbi:flavodoxin family protein [Maribacter halichondriae]|uniref:flavodoxin family protein n=1 Tax=Maribacter halichondriae TaxID=2980554 RepID=UPI002359A6D7|nr:flavodoxin [Maribacter sp. Hal144]